MSSNETLGGSKLLHHDASTAAFVFYLKFFFSIWLVRYLFDPIQNLSLLPVEYSVPIGWMNGMPGFLYEAAHSYSVLLVMRIVIVACCIGIWFGRARRISGLVGCVLLTTVNAIARGYGHLNHAEIGLLLITWVLTIFMLRFSTDQLSRPNHQRDSTASAALVCSTIVLSFVYSLVGIARVVDGGLTIFTGDTMPNFMFKASYMNSVVDLDLTTWILSLPMLVVLVKAGTVAVTVMEILAPFCLISKKIRYTMLCVMPGFHIGAILLFKVIFIEQILCMILFVSMSSVLARGNLIEDARAFVRGIRRERLAATAVPVRRASE